MDKGELSQGIEFLAEQGLNLFATLRCEALPDDVVKAMLAEDIPLHDYTNLILVGHGGRRHV